MENRIARLSQLREKFPVGQPIVLVEHRNTILSLVKVRSIIISKYSQLANSCLDSEDEEDLGLDLDNYLDSFEELDSLGINFDDIPECEFPLKNFLCKFESIEDLLSSMDVFIDWFIQADIGLSSEDYSLLNIQVSETTGEPIVFGYNSGMF